MRAVGELDRDGAQSLVFGYAVGLDLTRRDLQAEAKAKGLPWDIGKAFDCVRADQRNRAGARVDDLACTRAHAAGQRRAPPARRARPT